MRKILSIHGSNPREENSDTKRIENIPIHSIKPNPYQPRKSFTIDSLEEMAQSIRQYGVIQPITVRKVAQDGYELITGERRLRAAKLAGLDYIPAIIMNAYEQDSAIMAMIENLQRENLHYLEEAKGYANLILDHEFTQEELALKLGKNQSTIANKLRILKLSNEIKDVLIREKLTERHARALLKLPDDESRMDAVRHVVDNKLNVRDTEEVVECIVLRDAEKQNKDRKRTEKTNNRKQKKVFKRTKDIRIFINTIKNSVGMLKSYGMPVHYSQLDKEDKIEIIVTIPKN
ncbi:MAG TPA: nucleoid occlusion protein [Clostridiales bacterium]|nr:nucleoid occlusion protein [Clostridiales bacterium]